MPGYGPRPRCNRALPSALICHLGVLCPACLLVDRGMKQPEETCSPLRSFSPGVIYPSIPSRAPLRGCAATKRTMRRANTLRASAQRSGYVPASLGLIAYRSLEALAEACPGLACCPISKGLSAGHAPRLPWFGYKD